MLQRILRRLVEVRQEETGVLLLMFSYSFLAMTAYNMVQPITRSKFITAHGAENLPVRGACLDRPDCAADAGLQQAWQAHAGALDHPGHPGGHGRTTGALLDALRGSDDRTGPNVAAVGTSAVQGWVATALYWFGQIYAILLITQFWTLANIIFDPRQAKRLFGFIGAGSSLGGFVGGSLPAFFIASSGQPATAARQRHRARRLHRSS